MANIARLDALLPLDPRVQRAGFWGGVVYLHLLLLNRAHQCQGLIPPEYAAPGYLAGYIGLDRAAYLNARAVDVVKDGMRAAVREGLIAIEPDGVRLVDRHHWECESAGRVRAFRARKEADRDKVAHRPDRTAQRGETRRDLPPDRDSLAHAMAAEKTGPTPPVASAPPRSSGSGVGSPQIAGRRVLRDPGMSDAPAVAHTETGEHDTSEGPTANMRNVTGEGPPPPFPPPSSPPLLVSPLNPLPYPPLSNPPLTPGDAPLVDCNDVTLHTLTELGLEDGDLELPFEPGWMGQPVTASNGLDEIDPPTHRGKPDREPRREVPDEAFTLAETLRAEIVKFNPQARIAGLNSDREDKLRADWAVVIDRLNRVDGVAWGEILATITWCFRTERYWAGVIVSARQLRDKWDQIQAQRVRAREGTKPAKPTTAPRAPTPPPPPPEDRGGPITIAEIRDAQRAVGVLHDPPENA